MCNGENKEPDYAMPYTKKFRVRNKKHHWDRYSASGAQAMVGKDKDNCCDRGDQIGGCKGKGFDSKEDACKALCALEEKERAELLDSN